MGELQKKEEEMRQMFVQRVKEKEGELKEAEKEVRVCVLVCACVRACVGVCECVLQHGHISSFLANDFEMRCSTLFLLHWHCQHLPPRTSTQLHEKFDRLKKLHQDEKKKLEDKRKSLDDELNMFKQKKTAAELLLNQAQQAGGSTTLKREKERKK